jgi:SAM-dependent methyltransferase
MGIDISPEMIEAFRKGSNGSNLECHECDVQAMPFPPDTFDLCTARMVFHHVESCMVGLAEVRRVLKPGGHLVLIEGVPPDHRTRERYEDIFRLKEKRHTFSEAELINMFNRAGFTGIALYPHFMKQVSLNNWLKNSALPEESIREITRLHVEADGYFKDVYNLKETGDDVLMDWKFAILLGTK